jgi:hypothetical protein
MIQDAHGCTTMLCKAEYKAREIGQHIVRGIVSLPIAIISGFYIQLVAFHYGSADATGISSVLLHPISLFVAVPMFLRSVFSIFMRFRNALEIWSIE